MINIKDFDARLLKIDKKKKKNHTKTLAFITLGISQRKKLMIIKILLLMRVDILKKKI